MLILEHISIYLGKIPLFLVLSFNDLNFDVIHAATGNRYVNGNDASLVNLSPFALFNSYKLTTIRGKLLEDISHAHIVSLLCKPITRAEEFNDLSFGFDRDCVTRQKEFTTNKNQEGKYQRDLCSGINLVMDCINKKSHTP